MRRRTASRQELLGDSKHMKALEIDSDSIADWADSLHRRNHYRNHRQHHIELVAAVVTLAAIDDRMELDRTLHRSKDPLQLL